MNTETTAALQTKYGKREEIRITKILVYGIRGNGSTTLSQYCHCAQTGLIKETLLTTKKINSY